MICLKDSIRYERVISANYQFYYKELGTYLERFLAELREKGAHPNGPFFYALNNVPKEERMKVEFFLPVREETKTGAGMKFHSYYAVEQMMSVRIRNEFEEKTQEAYSAMMHYMEAAKLIQVTPFFHIVDRVGTQTFVTVKVGYRKV